MNIEGRINKIQSILRYQHHEAKLANGIKVTCQCEKSISITKMYKCHHCGIYFCRPCGADHFGVDETGLVGNSLTKSN